MDLTSLFNNPVNYQAPQGHTNVPISDRFGIPQRGQDEGYVEKDPKHMGIAGVARDVLGTLGDFLLTRLRMPAMYAPAQESRKLNAAMQGFDQNPTRAIEAVTDVSPAMGMKLRDQTTDNTRLAQQAAELQEYRDSRIAQAKAAEDARTMGMAANMLNTMTDWSKAERAAKYPLLRDQIRAMGKKKGAEIDIPENYDDQAEIALEAFIGGHIPAGTQRSQALTDRRNDILERQGGQRLDISRDNSETSRNNANRPRAVQAYTGEDGFRYTRMSDGTTIKSDQKVLQQAPKRRVAPVLRANSGPWKQGGKFYDRDARGRVIEVPAPQ